MGLDVEIRHAKPEEHRLIYATWIRTQQGSKARKQMHPKVHDEGLHRLITKLLERDFACVAEYEGIVAGYIVGRYCTVHYVFVKEPYRRQGIAKKLLATFIHEGEQTRITHKPEEHRNIPIPSSWVYDPFAAWAPE